MTSITGRSPYPHTKHKRQPVPPPVRTVLLPPQVGNVVNINPILGMSNGLSILYDISTPPASLHLKIPHLYSQMLCQTATQPPLPSLSVISPFLPWVITVPAGTMGFVTVLDVFHAIYEALRLPVTEVQFRALDSSYSVISRTGDWWQGMRRRDFLRGRTRFMGLSMSMLGPDTWMLNVQ